MYCQAINHVFEECPIFNAQQMYPEPMNAAFSRPQNDSYLKCTILAGESTRISHGTKTTMTTQGQTISNILSIIKILPIINPITIIILPIINIIINKTFLTMLHNLSSKVLHLRKNNWFWEEYGKAYEKPRVPHTNIAVQQRISHNKVRGSNESTN